MSVVSDSRADYRRGDLIIFIFLDRSDTDRDIFFQKQKIRGASEV